jgi:hypothetical protein
MVRRMTVASKSKKVSFEKVIAVAKILKPVSRHT